MNPAPPWVAPAQRRAPFLRLVRVELAKAVGTRSDKILVALGLPLAAGLVVLISQQTDTVVSGFAQLQVLLVTLPLGQVLVMSSVVKLVSGEWHHRSVQPTLLAQPSRGRFLAAQTVVVALLLVLVTVVQVAAALVVQQQLVRRLHAQDVVAARPGWAAGVVVVAAATSALLVLAVALLLPSTPTALTVYLTAAIVLLVLRTGFSAVDQWFDPYGVALWWSGDPALGSPLPSVLALLLLLIALVAGVRAVRRRDAA